MLHENEVMAAVGICSGGFSSRQMFGPSLRVRKPVTWGRHWLQIYLLVVLLAGQASSDQNTTVFSPLPTLSTSTQTLASYFVEISVDVTGQKKNESEIIAWLNQVLQDNLGNCVSAQPETTAVPSSPHTTTATSNETTQAIAATTTQQTYNTTAAITTPQNFSTTVATTSTTLEGNSTATATTTTTLDGNSTTTATTTTTLEGNSTTTATTTTTSDGNGTTTATTNPIITATTAQNDSTASSTTNTSVTTSDGREKNTPPRNPNANRSRQRIARQISSTQSLSMNNNTTGLLQKIEVSCGTKTEITNTTCHMTLWLAQTVSSCCILRTLWEANKNFTDMCVVGKRADRVGQLQKEASSNPGVYSGPAGASCIDQSGAAYAVLQSNSTSCVTDFVTDLSNCSCSAYCNRSEAYYTFNISIQEPLMNSSYVASLISKLQQLPSCSASTDVSCELAVIAAKYKDVKVICGSAATNSSSCSAILVFSQKIPICLVATALMDTFQPENHITFNGQVIRAAICGNSAVNSNPLQSQLTWVEINLKPAEFCPAMQESNILPCQNGTSVVVELEEQCVPPVFSTIRPNVTTMQPNSTTTPANATLNVTSQPVNTTAQQNTTGDLTTSTTAGNTTVTTTLSTNTTITEQSVSVTTSESPTTTESDESQANALLELTRDVSTLNSSQVNQLVSQLESLLSGPTVSLALGNISVNIVSNLLGAPPEVLSESSNRIIRIVDTVGLKLVIGDEAETILSPAVALSVKPADGTNFQETIFSISDPSNVQVRRDPRLRRNVKTDSSTPQGSIRLPPTLTQNLTAEEQQLVSRVQFNFYQKSTVFQDQSLGERRLNSGILGASVANLSIRGLQDDVVINLRNTEPIPANFVATCVFWDFTFNNGSGGWNSNGCFVQNSTDDETICACNHLTSFAVLLNLSRQPVTSRLQATILTFITYIGCGISAIFLSVTLLTYLAFGKLRKDIPSKILIHLCLALLLLNLVFLVDAWLALYPEAVGLCISTAWFLHYFLLVSFTWMGLEAVHMYLALVKVFNSYISRYMLKFSLVGWGVPMIVVIIVIAIDKNNYGLVSYGRFDDGTSDDFCWLKNDIAFYVAVVAYFCAIFLFNFIMFIVVLVQLHRIKKQNPQSSQHRTTMQDVRSVVGITILLGLTWGFAFFAWGPLNLPFMYLFAIFNSLQGFFIFVFHCAVKENVRRQWRTYLCCGRMRLAENSEWSRTATQKTVKKGSLTKLTSLHSNSSRGNNSSSSSSFLVSESSNQMNGIGSPFDDTTITADEDPSMDVVLNEINRQYRNPQVS
ncbi:adhesion G-protein coupled receptor G2 isoform X2 [Mugil cephalus]|uniref:adhesion G-protein coupled receptor G2 isoform X2 n=1 Tax=Mugil cephalus TaxID=48193 RepID=UPI001FB59BD8|nr:adhesion G-protein coupled receptor G2 isoform X2 [Mugil cephalus]